MKMAVRRGLIGFAASLYLLVSPLAGSIQNDMPLFEQSYNLSQSLDGHERIFYLIELCHLGSSLKLPEKDIRQWSAALFDAGSTEQDMRVQAVAQKNAVSCISSVDPAAAMDLLTRVNFQRPAPGKWDWEDPRFNAAATVFVDFLDKTNPPNSSSIIEKARYLGRTGQYPYLAVANLIKRTPKAPLPTKAEIDTLLNDALGFYAHETGFYNRDDEFRHLLRELNNPQIDKDIASRLTAAFVLHLQNDPIRIPGDYYGEVQVPANGASPAKVFPFTDRNAAFLFREFPIIQQLNPTLAAQLSRQNPILNEATSQMGYTSGGFTQGNPTPEETAQIHLQWLQESLIGRIKQLSITKERLPSKITDLPDSTLAAQLAQRLNDTSSRIVGFSAAVPVVAQDHLSEACAMYNNQLSELDNLGPSLGRLRAMVALAPAAYVLGDFKENQLLNTQAFELGVSRYNNDAKAMRAQVREGFQELRELVTTTASQSADLLQAQVNGLPDSWLKAYLELYEAVGGAKQKLPPVPRALCPVSGETQVGLN